MLFVAHAITGYIMGIYLSVDVKRLRDIIYRYILSIYSGYIFIHVVTSVERCVGVNIASVPRG